MFDKQLPAHPSLEQYKKQAKELARDCALGLPAALERIARHHPRLHNHHRYTAPLIPVSCLASRPDMQRFPLKSLFCITSSATSALQPLRVNATLARRCIGTRPIRNRPSRKPLVFSPCTRPRCPLCFRRF